MLKDGRRQITSFYIPGDICDLSWIQREAYCQPVKAITELEAVPIACEEVRHRVQSNPHLFELLHREVALRSSIMAEHSLSLGRRTSAERLGHLFCEIYWRMTAAGLVSHGECAMPMTQLDVADLCGLTAVHVNRVLQELRGADLLELKGRQLKIHDIDRLSRLAMFDARYLIGLDNSRLISMVC